MIPNKIGRYEIKSQIGQGGMATVFLAFDPDMHREVAIKVLPREFLNDPTFRARFRREARVIASLDHPAILPVYDFGEDDGLLFFVMPLMSGGSLADQLKHGPLSISDTIKLLARIGPALDYAHQKGVIHRDLKPGNILFDRFGNAFLADFGIAHLEQGSATLTGGNIIGTPAYMSPEQARATQELDGRTDIYALGVMLFEMLTGQTPYKADTGVGIVLMHITEPVPHVLDIKPDLPSDFEHVIMRAMAKDRDERFSTANDLSSAVSFVANGTPLPQDFMPQSSITSAIASSTSRPFTPVPTTSASSTPVSFTPAPITPAPFTPSPITPAPVTRTPVTPAPSTVAPSPPASPAVTQPTEKKRFSIPLILGLGLMSLCLLISVASIIIIGNRNNFWGLGANPTETPTTTPSIVPSATFSVTPGITASLTSTSTKGPTQTHSPTPTKTASPTDTATSVIATPTLATIGTPESTTTRVSVTTTATRLLTRTASPTNPPPTNPPPTNPPPTNPPPTNPPPTNPPPTNPPPTNPPPTNPPPTNPPPTNPPPTNPPPTNPPPTVPPP